MVGDGGARLVGELHFTASPPYSALPAGAACWFTCLNHKEGIQDKCREETVPAMRQTHVRTQVFTEQVLFLSHLSGSRTKTTKPGGFGLPDLPPQPAALAR